MNIIQMALLEAFKVGNIHRTSTVLKSVTAATGGTEAERWCLATGCD